ncbi:MAG TPA: hypothetical protein DCP97_01130 [Ruminococcaceae bacterium]|nr:hypothetical protein [Oscillospiraceae bacterium]
MIAFKPIEISDKDWITDLLKRSSYLGADYNFTNNFNWRKIYNVKVARINDYYVLKSGKTHPAYLFPAGSGDIKPVIDEMIADAKDNGHRFIFHTVLQSDVARLNEMYPNKFEFKEVRDNFDYIYDAQKLITLSGKKLHSKRNHISRFIENNPSWTYEPITKQNIDECWEMNKKWCEINGCVEDPDKRNEMCSVKSAFEYFFELGLTGGALRVDGKIIAYAMGEQYTDNAYIVHIEKAFSDIQGAYPMINQQFAINNCQNVAYINREDDTGSEGLRKAKLSYYPAILLVKYSAELKED